MDEIAVLVLNYTFEPLHFTNARRAITLLLAGKAEAVEASPRGALPLGDLRAAGGDQAGHVHPEAVPGPRGVQQEEHPPARRLHLPVLQPARRAAHGRSRGAALARRRDELGERGRGLSAL